MDPRDFLQLFKIMAGSFQKHLPYLGSHSGFALAGTERSGYLLGGLGCGRRLKGEVNTHQNTTQALLRYETNIFEIFRRQRQNAMNIELQDLKKYKTQPHVFGAVHWNHGIQIVVGDCGCTGPL